MLVGDWADTFLNLGTFAFIGLMVWLLRRKLPKKPDGPDGAL